MKVSELIERLKTLSPDATVCVGDTRRAPSAPLVGVEEVDDEEGDIVFLDVF